MKIIVPITDWKDRYEIAPWMIKIDPDLKNGLTKNASADCFQVRSVSEQRFVRRVGLVNKTKLDKIKIGLSKVLSIENE